MQVILVSAEVTQAAACIFVKAGAHYDTIDGIAHLLEHMLFLGSKKYPDDNHYQKLLS
jgi:secreted Zn-dependent insulinase-like peptidase